MCELRGEVSCLAGLAAISLAFAFHQAVIRITAKTHVDVRLGREVASGRERVRGSEHAGRLPAPRHRAPVALHDRRCRGLPTIWATTKIVLAPAGHIWRASRIPFGHVDGRVLPIAMFCSWGSVRIYLWTGQIALPLLGAVC